IEWAEKGVRKEDYVQPWLRKLGRKNAYGVFFIFKSMEQGRTFRVTVPKFPTKDANHRILAHQKSRFTHNYFYIRDEVLRPFVMPLVSLFSLQEDGLPHRLQLYRATVESTQGGLPQARYRLPRR